ncbi:macrolide transport system ATP-binding/permease protein [Amphibacillus marinus]|uniref:Macrolide transport system ATP-binding/permease protein n=1 Tax=Amphibacillus marinus TaxID=872970 RepID=A0A1H8RI41_9BACI|nr:ABC-F type ribosomal protection protein [Amphibacillus marinus]SEO65828.1 macrolide transport system ATP-binding/permease protein [Amphibacillus marinus]
MVMVELLNVVKEIQGEQLFTIDSLTIAKQAKIGLVGKNGAGKSTLLNLIAGYIEPEQGHIKRFGSVHLLPQLKTTHTTESGGEVTQRYIDQALAHKSELLLADEPTTNLDQQHIEKLAQHLTRRSGAIVLVAHDRYFLDLICTEIWEIDQQTVKRYSGNYSSYRDQKQLEQAQQEEAYQNYLRQKRELERAVVLKERKAQRATKKPKNVSDSEARIIGVKPYFAKKQKKLEQTKKAMETRLAQLEKVDKVYQEEPIKMQLPEADRSLGRTIIRIENLSGQIGKRLLWQAASFQINGGDKVALIGNNGVGKSTLIEKLVNQDEAIYLSPAAKIGYFSQKLKELDLSKSILANVTESAIQTETMIRIVLARLHFHGEDVYKPVNVLSGGERVKVTLAKLFVSDVNVLILDEPTNFLDLGAVEALETILADYPGTLIFVSHDRRFVEKLANRLIIIADQKVELFPGTYQAYRQKSKPANNQELDLMVIETRITEVLSRLSIEPNQELEQDFQMLLKQKQALQTD